MELKQKHAAVCLAHTVVCVSLQKSASVGMEERVRTATGHVAVCAATWNFTGIKVFSVSCSAE